MEIKKGKNSIATIAIGLALATIPVVLGILAVRQYDKFQAGRASKAPASAV